MKTMMTIHNTGEITWLSLPGLEMPGLRHGFSTRMGGVSSGYLSSMNLSFGVGDQRENVLENFSRISKAIGFPPEDLVLTNQVHEDRIRKVTGKDRGDGILRETVPGIDGLISKAWFISPIVDMEKLIYDMMAWANATEKELQSKGVIHTGVGEDLTWAYLCYVRDHPVDWTVPTQILYGSRDELTTPETIRSFAEKHNARLTVMEGGEHWFHTEEQMRFLDEWMRYCGETDKSEIQAEGSNIMKENTSGKNM